MSITDTSKDYLNADEIKKEELGLLIEFRRLCKENNLRYALCGGTLLGAIRHRGFIPWDDDIDVNMPRPDYNRLIQMHKEGFFANKRFDIVPNIESEVGSGFILKFVARDIVVKEHYRKELRNLWVDIIPVDGLPSESTACDVLYARNAKLRRIVVMGYADTRYGRSLSHKIIKNIYHLVDKDRWITHRCEKELLANSIALPYEQSDYIGAVTWGLYGSGERMLRKEYENFVPVSFEGEEFNAPSCWDSYLRGIYGDYMQLPPAEKRMTHELEAWRV